MNTNDLDFDDDVEEGSFLKRNWLALTVGVLVLAGGTSAAIALSSKGGAGTRKAQDVTMVQLPPPPVVLPPPPPPPPEESQMIKDEEDTPKEEAPADTAPATGIVGNGPPDSFNMAKKGAGGRRYVAPPSPMSVWRPYALQAASRIADAMRHHSKLKSSTMSITVRVWIDATGRITRATAQSTGDAAIDAALKGEVLTGIQLSGPPPEGMQMPVNLKVTARRP